MGVLASASYLPGSPAWAQADTVAEQRFDQLNYPPFSLFDRPDQFGYKPPSPAERTKAADIVRSTPKGPKPIDVAESFVSRFYQSDPDAISQWPAPESWNPLIVEFFSATSVPANNDMVAWCAAFANWCMERAGRVGSRSAASQSFIASKAFKKTNDPEVGDLIVFTCYDKSSGKSLGLGHVAFVGEKPANGRVKVIGGNQSKDGRSSVICASDFPLGDREVRRHVDGKYVPCTMRLNSFVSVV